MKKNLQKGITLYLVIVLLAVVLSIVLGISSLLITQIKIIGGMGDSVVAFYAAETGAEKLLQIISSGGTILPQYQSVPGTFENDASYQVEIVCSTANSNCPSGLDDDSNCLGTQYCIRSMGIFNNTRRALEIKI